MKNNQSQKGFTLIEILVVIGMIAILATIVLIAINPARQFQQGRDTQRTSNVNAILNAIGQYTADNKGTLPGSIPTSPTTADAGTLCSSLMPTYLPSLPVDPSITTGPITACTGTPTTSYTVTRDASGRVTVSATGEITNPISVTR
jgi:prepilin-type N-terminal cleavage/methylation domain-containing protein